MVIVIHTIAAAIDGQFQYQIVESMRYALTLSLTTAVHIFARFWYHRTTVATRTNNRIYPKKVTASS